jgi:hypothetical protein
VRKMLIAAIAVLSLAPFAVVLAKRSLIILRASQRRKLTIAHSGGDSRLLVSYLRQARPIFVPHEKTPERDDLVIFNVDFDGQKSIKRWRDHLLHAGRFGKRAIGFVMAAIALIIVAGLDRCVETVLDR